jgi:ankyrin repeat protein
MRSNRFRWVYCQLEALQPCFPNNLRRMLEELPKSLDETYQRILKEINNANQKQAHQLLQCLAVAHRPLRVKELAEVLALDVDAAGIPRFNPNWRWEDHEAAVLSACSSLVSVIIGDGSRVVQFSHFSVKEFLTSDRLASMEDVSQFHIANEPSHAILAQACLGVYLSMEDRTSEGSVKDIALLPYADQYLVEHALVGKVELHIKDALDCLFDLDKPHFEAHLCRTGMDREFRPLRAPSNEDPEGVLTPATPLFVACRAGLSGLAERLIVTNRLQVIGFRFHGWTLLHWAVRDKHIEVARLLLAQGADINSRPDYATPLHIAPLQSRFESQVDGSLENIDRMENSSQNRYADVCLHERIDEYMGYREESGFTPLQLAVSQGYLGMCQMLLEHKADVRAHDNGGNTPLHLAASKDHLDIARILLKYNAEVNSQNEGGSTPLLIVSSSGNIDIFRLLLAHNADTSVQDNRGNTPLHLAAVGGRLEVACSLLQLKADVNALNNEGLTPLQRASEGQRKGYLDIMRLLLDYGANVNVHGKRRNTPLHFAASEGYLEVSRMLLECKANTNALDDEGSTPLHQASQNSRSGDADIVQLVRLLLDNGADLHTRDNSGNIPLHFAASKGHLEVTRILLELKADVDSLNSEGLTPLQRASEGQRKGYLDIMRLLLDHGARVNVHDNRRNTPLHFAASEGHLEVARMLLERKADVNALDDEGSNPLHQASHSSRSGDADITQLVRLLLDNGADIHARDKNGNTPLHFAASEGHLEVARMLLERKADVNALNDKGLNSLHRASHSSWSGDAVIAQLVQLLLDYGADLNTRDNSRNTPLHFAASKGHLEVARILLELKADVNAPNKERSTPLHQAFEAWRENPDIVRLLLDYGADSNANVHDKSGNTLLHFAASEGDIQLARILLERNPEVVNSQNDDGTTAFLLALRRRNPDIARLLLDHNADEHVCDKHGDTPLHLAVLLGYLDVCRVLLERNADVNSKNYHGSTPLLHASEFGTPDIVQLMLDYNADVQARHANGDTLLHRAAIKDQLEVARLLLKLNVEVNSRNNDGSTPLHLVSAGYMAGNPDVVRLLLDHGAEVNARNLSGQTAFEVACGLERWEIVKLLSRHAGE